MATGLGARVVLTKEVLLTDTKAAPLLGAAALVVNVDTILLCDEFWVSDGEVLL